MGGEGAGPALGVTGAPGRGRTRRGALALNCAVAISCNQAPAAPAKAADIVGVSYVQREGIVQFVCLFGLVNRRLKFALAPVINFLGTYREHNRAERAVELAPAG
jgi:hypothetical protein